MNKISLIDPTELLQENLIPMINKIGKEEGGFQGVEEPLNSESFSAYVRRLTDEANGMNLQEGWVPMNTYWLVKDGIYPVGISKLRHRLTEELIKRGGHIGYWVSPSERRKGYGTRLLAMTCEKAKIMDIKRVLVTCHRVNIGSIKIIEKNCGFLDGTLSPQPNEGELHFWIDLS